MDIVIPWVDGNDPKWIEEFERYADIDDGLKHVARFRDWDNLQCLFRGLERFCPWLGSIYFVTWGHLPKWMSQNNDKLKIIKHEEFMPIEFLPTFSSRAIEMNLHRIKGLSENFVLFNDDTFVLKLMKEEDFFRKGLPCDAATATINAARSFHPFQHTLLNASTFANKYGVARYKAMLAAPTKWITPAYKFKQNIKNLLLLLASPRHHLAFENYHLPQPMRKSTLAKAWELEPGIMDKTSAAKFRKMDGLNPYAVRYLELACNHFYPINKEKQGKNFNLNSSQLINDACEYIKQQKGKMICLNDTEETPDFELTKAQVNAALESIFPNKSSFEL